MINHYNGTTDIKGLAFCIPHLLPISLEVSSYQNPNLLEPWPFQTSKQWGKKKGETLIVSSLNDAFLLLPNPRQIHGTIQFESYSENKMLWQNLQLRAVCGTFFSQLISLLLKLWEGTCGGCFLKTCNDFLKLGYFPSHSRNVSWRWKTLNSDRVSLRYYKSLILPNKDFIR